MTKRIFLEQCHKLNWLTTDKYTELLTMYYLDAGIRCIKFPKKTNPKFQKGKNDASIRGIKFQKGKNDASIRGIKFPKKTNPKFQNGKNDESIGK